MSWTLLKEEEEVGIDPSPKSFCKTVVFVCASLRCHILISNGDSCRLIVGGSPHLLRFFEDVGVAVEAAAMGALAVSNPGLIVLIVLLLVLAPFLSSGAAFLVR